MQKEGDTTENMKSAYVAVLKFQTEDGQAEAEILYSEGQRK